jgi:deoxyribodipyrimidine photo-lyase
MSYTIFIFRRDLRAYDNTSLNYAISNFERVIPIFIFTPEQITETNKFKSDNAIQFMVESLKHLNKNLDNKLCYFYGDNIEILTSICDKIPVESIIFNSDYTKYSRIRDGKITKFCKSKNIQCHSSEDYLLSKVGEFNKDDGKPYSVFTPFKENAMSKKIAKPTKYKIRNITTSSELKSLEINISEIKYTPNDSVLVHGGRALATVQLAKAIKNQKEYNDNRDQLSTETTQLSAYIKFGCISIREVYWIFYEKLGSKSLLLSQLIWREFYYYIAYYHPDVLSASRDNFRSTFPNIKWTNNAKHIEAWKTGNTGFPVVDAGMRQLNKTGYMHNRSRLITANFLNRILNTDWRIGELYYATKLVDYDPSVNNGNWQWVASTGVDTAQYFQRVFSPILQSKRYDSDCEYIKQWVPELKDVASNHIHDWEKHLHKYPDIKYVTPIISYSYGRTRSLKAYKDGQK